MYKYISSAYTCLLNKHYLLYCAGCSREKEREKSEEKEQQEQEQPKEGELQETQSSSWWK